MNLLSFLLCVEFIFMLFQICDSPSSNHINMHYLCRIVPILTSGIRLLPEGEEYPPCLSDFRYACQNGVSCVKSESVQSFLWIFSMCCKDDDPVRSWVKDYSTMLRTMIQIQFNVQLRSQILKKSKISSKNVRPQMSQFPARPNWVALNTTWN